METATLPPSLAELRARLPGLTPRDQRRLGRRLEDAAALRDAAARDEALGQLITELEAAAARVEARQHAVPPVSYPPELPVSQRKDEIAAAIRDNQVVIVAGETGSGKTTQLPKICLELGRGVTGQIGHHPAFEPGKAAVGADRDRGDPAERTIGQARQRFHHGVNASPHPGRSRGKVASRKSVR